MTGDGGIGPISPYDPPTGFSAHREPRAVGGKRYWKCQYCGVESIWWRERDMTSERIHKDYCGHPDVGPEVMADGGTLRPDREVRPDRRGGAVVKWASVWSWSL
jgi:hypothetical protein